jgi:hypothetical protein
VQIIGDATIFVPFALVNLFIFTYSITITGISAYSMEKVLLLESNARLDGFALCAAMLLSKQLLWHSTVVAGLKWLLTLSILFLSLNIMP